MEIILRTALYLDLTALFGLAAFGSHGLRGSDRQSAEAQLLSRSAVVLAFIGVPLTIASVWLTAATMADVAIDAVDRGSIADLLWGTAVGTASLVRLGALVITITAASFFAATKPIASSIIAVLASGIALATLAWGGHGAMDDGLAGSVHLIADIVHLLMAGLWIGALVALTGMLFARHGSTDLEHISMTHRALARFSATGSIAVAGLVLTGLINSWFLVGSNGALTLAATTYGRILAVKIMLFCAMLAFAARNRFMLVPDLQKSLTIGEGGAIVFRLRSSLALETAIAVVVLMAVAWLGTLEPPMSAM